MSFTIKISKTNQFNPQFILTDIEFKLGINDWYEKEALITNLDKLSNDIKSEIKAFLIKYGEESVIQDKLGFNLQGWEVMDYFTNIK